MLIFAIAKGREPVAKLPSFFSVPAFGVTDPGLGFSRPTPGFSKPSEKNFTPSGGNFARRVVTLRPGFEKMPLAAGKTARWAVPCFGTQIAQVG